MANNGHPQPGAYDAYVTRCLRDTAIVLGEGLQALGLGEKIHSTEKAVMAPNRGLTIALVHPPADADEKEPVLHVTELGERLITDTMQSEMTVVAEEVVPLEHWVDAVRSALMMVCQSRVDQALQKAVEKIPCRPFDETRQPVAEAAP